MIYNENGMIINEEYCLLEYINNYHKIDDMINESLNEVINGIKTAGQILHWLIENVGYAIKYITELPNRNLIKKNKDQIIKKMNDIIKENDNLVIIYGNITKYICAKGYGKWFINFDNAVKSLESNPSLTENDVNKLLYDGTTTYDFDNFFALETTKKIKLVNNINPTNIVNAAISTKNDLDKLRQSYKTLKNINKSLDQGNKIKTDIMIILRGYFINAISSYRKLSSESIKLCINVLKNNGSNIEIIDKDDFKNNTTNRTTYRYKKMPNKSKNYQSNDYQQPQKDYDTFDTNLEIFNVYKSLPEVLRKKSLNFISDESESAFVSTGIMKLERFWDFIKEEYLAGRIEYFEKLKQVFDFFFEMKNESGQVYLRNECKIGDEYNYEKHIMMPGGKNLGSVSEVILLGFSDNKGKIIRKTIVRVN